MTSASLPFSRLPTRSATPLTIAELMVIDLSASSSGIPSRTQIPAKIGSKAVLEVASI